MLANYEIGNMQIEVVSAGTLQVRTTLEDGTFHRQCVDVNDWDKAAELGLTEIAQQEWQSITDGVLLNDKLTPE